ncbi:MAG TPA: DPP IV N-terminal domain-containing protein [Pyrinomonadaceae bacterium]|nr:DPP IV N-terminal domain-containing protein [Pyrinomonadaceae bacterium]
MSLTLRHLYKFDSFIVDVNERLLLRDGRMVPLTPKVFETLLLLVKNQGSIVTKEKMLTTLWPDVFVEESNVTFNIRMLRKALGDTKQSSLYIETIPRRGYRFKTQVREVLGEDTSIATARPEVSSHSGNGKLEAIQSTERKPILDLAGTLAPQTTAKPARLTGTNRIPLFAALAGVLLLMGTTAIWRLNRLSSVDAKREPKAIVRMPLTPGALKIDQVTTFGNVIGVGISPDGKQLAYVEENNGQQALWLKQLATGVNVRLTSPGYVAYNKLTFSHDGNYIYFTEHGENDPSALYRIPVLGGPPARLLENVDSGPSLSPDETKVAFRRRDRIAREDTLFIADLNSGEQRAIIKHRPPDWLFAFSWSPNGKVIVCATGETDSGRQTMKISEVNVETGKEKLLVKPNWYFIQQFEWLSDGSGLLICAKEKFSPEIWEMSYPDGRLQKLTEDLNYYISLSLTADASKLVTIQSKLVSQLWISPDLDVSKAKNIAGGRGKLAWLPDGRIVYDYASRVGSDLWIAKPDGTDPKQLIFNAGFNDWPAVSPDGTTIVFQSDRSGSQHLWRMNSDGSNQTQLTNGYAERNAAISSDGKWVYYNSSTENSLWKVALDGGEPVKLTDDYSAYPSVSPDGKLLATFRFPKYGHEAMIIVRNADDMRTVTGLKLARGFWISRTIQWEPDNKALIYALQDGGQVKLYRQSLSDQPPHELTSLQAEDEFEFAISPKRQLAYISTKWDHDIVLISGLK